VHVAVNFPILLWHRMYREQRMMGISAVRVRCSEAQSMGSSITNGKQKEKKKEKERGCVYRRRRSRKAFWKHSRLSHLAQASTPSAPEPSSPGTTPGRPRQWRRRRRCKRQAEGEDETGMIWEALCLLSLLLNTDTHTTGCPAVGGFRNDFGKWWRGTRIRR